MNSYSWALLSKTLSLNNNCQHRMEVYFCHQNQNAKNIGNFTTLFETQYNSGTRLKGQGIETSLQVVPLFLKSFHICVSYNSFWNFLKIPSVFIRDRPSAVSRTYFTTCNFCSVFFQSPHGTQIPPKLSCAQHDICVLAVFCPHTKYAWWRQMWFQHLLSVMVSWNQQ
jgi:hypothetical protein